jgi:hypothetical protein
MQRIAATARIYETWNEEQWTVDGAAVDVSLICFGESEGAEARLNGAVVSAINPDLTSGLNLTLARALAENRGGAYLGIQKSGPFDVPGELARSWMREPTNPNGRCNSEVLKPYWNGDDVAGRPRDIWFIDLPLGLSKADASLFVRPFEYLTAVLDEDGKTVQQLREALGERAGPRWWEPHWPRPEMRSKITSLRRYIVTPETAQYRLFVWLSYPELPDKNLIVIPREDDLMFGLLHSRFHEAWALRKGSDLEDRPRYTHTSTFATFPFPEGMTPNIDASEACRLPTASSIEEAARELDDLRSAWLNPRDCVTCTREIVVGFPDRFIPIDDEAARELSSRTLTILYNERPTWLVEVHKKLDAAVALAYGWSPDISTEEALSRLFELNQTRAKSARDLLPAVGGR